MQTPKGYETTRLCGRRTGASGTLSHRSGFRDIEIRKAAGGRGATLVGYAAVFNVPSRPMGNGSGRFIEIVKPGAFGKALAAGADVRALFDHETSQILGRTKSGTLNLWEDNTGLAFNLSLPDSQAGMDAESCVRRGDVDGMSFGFRKIADSWSKDANGMNTRTLEAVEPFDVSPTAFPAYPGTSVRIAQGPGLRSRSTRETRDAEDDDDPRIQQEDGAWFVVDADDEHLAGPFASKAQAQAALDALPDPEEESDARSMRQARRRLALLDPGHDEAMQSARRQLALIDPEYSRLAIDSYGGRGGFDESMETARRQIQLLEAECR